MENELENLKKIHEQDLDSIMALTEEIDRLKEQIQNQKLNELQTKKKELENEIAEENYKLFMSTPRQPIRQEEVKEESKVRSLDEILLED